MKVVRQMSVQNGVEQYFRGVSMYSPTYCTESSLTAGYSRRQTERWPGKIERRSERTDLLFVPYADRQAIPEGHPRTAITGMLRPLLEVLGEFVTCLATVVNCFGDTGLLQVFSSCIGSRSVGNAECFKRSQRTLYALQI